MLHSNSNLVRMDDVGFRRDGKWLIRHVSFTVQPGQIITIVGPNGSGKSTTLKVLTGILKPSEGKVISNKSLKIGYVPQSLAVDGTMPISVRRMMNLAGNVKTDAIDATMARFHIDHLANSQVQSLSGGEFQRLLLARAIMARPQLLVLDEPSQGVDFSGQMEIYDYIREYRDQTGASVVLVSHDLHLVMAATDQVICINGHVCCSGTPEGVANNPQYLEMFGPHAAQALAIYRHNHDHIHLPDGNVRHADGTITDNCHREDGHHHESPE